MRTPFCCAERSSHHPHRQKTEESHKDSLLLFGRSAESRTPGLQYPKLARYQLRYTSKNVYKCVWNEAENLRFLTARRGWRSLLKHSRTTRKGGLCSYYFLFLRIRNAQNDYQSFSPAHNCATPRKYLLKYYIKVKRVCQ